MAGQKSTSLFHILTLFPLLSLQLVSGQDCTAGFFNNGTGICAPCPTGTFSLAAATECTDCPIGFTQFDESDENIEESSCDTGCQPGYYFDGVTCSICSAGTYTHNVTVASLDTGGCFSCDEGFTTDGINPSSGCVLCAAGYGGRRVFILKVENGRNWVE